MSAWPARVVLLGASGHIGRALTARLERDRVTVVPHTSKTLDLTRPEALVALDGALGPDSALVFASALTPDRGQTPETFMANVAMATNLAKYLAGRAPGLCVSVSSDAVYGFDVNPVTESTPVSPGGYYALGKYSAERVMELRGPRGRLSPPHAPGDRRLWAGRSPWRLRSQCLRPHARPRPRPAHLRARERKSATTSTSTTWPGSWPASSGRAPPGSSTSPPARAGPSPTW